jgi:DNA-binding GntR family transcriptional regulator
VTRQGRPGNQSELTYRELKDLIVSGQLGPSSRLVEAQIARELHVSRTPVRDALRRLLNEQLVSRDSTGALVVHRASQREIEDIYMIREVLDGLAARIVARRIGETELLWMTDTIEAMRVALSRGELGEVIAANIAFHDILYDVAGNPRLQRMGQELRDFVRLFSREPMADIARAAEIIEEHNAILEALRKGDSDRAEEAGRAHIRRAREHLSLAALNRSLTMAPAV